MKQSSFLLLLFCLQNAYSAELAVSNLKDISWRYGKAAASECKKVLERINNDSEVRKIASDHLKTNPVIVYGKCKIVNAAQKKK